MRKITCKLCKCKYDESQSLNDFCSINCSQFFDKYHRDGRVKYMEGLNK